MKLDHGGIVKDIGGLNCELKLVEHLYLGQNVTDFGTVKMNTTTNNSGQSSKFKFLTFYLRLGFLEVKAHSTPY